jgi:protein-S-isoprenylcysteine O-methyltransferase Ste14
MNAKIIFRYGLRETMGTIIMGVALFWSAGEINWWPAWAAIGVMAAWSTAMAIVMIRFNPDLFTERLGPRTGAKLWDTAIMSVLGMTQLARYIVAGLDQRFRWSGDFPIGVQLAALIVCILAYSLFVWATASNSFFSQIVRIQSERNHAVAKGGPYAFVRHPAYLGAIMFELAVPFLFASWWVLLISGLSVLLLILRTALEDRTLLSELSGYEDFSRQVRYRLIPGIW